MSVVTNHGVSKLTVWRGQTQLKYLQPNLCLNLPFIHSFIYFIFRKSNTGNNLGCGNSHKFKYNSHIIVLH
jgi:hypothetical protein